MHKQFSIKKWQILNKFIYKFLSNKLRKICFYIGYRIFIIQYPFKSHARGVIYSTSPLQKSNFSHHSMTQTSQKLCNSNAFKMKNHAVWIVCDGIVQSNYINATFQNCNVDKMLSWMFSFLLLLMGEYTQLFTKERK